MDAHAVKEVVDAAAEVDVMAVEVASEEVVGVVASAWTDLVEAVPLEQVLVMSSIAVTITTMSQDEFSFKDLFLPMVTIRAKMSQSKLSRSIIRCTQTDTAIPIPPILHTKLILVLHKSFRPTATMMAYPRQARLITGESDKNSASDSKMLSDLG